jgi:hypothetical protein
VNDSFVVNNTVAYNDTLGDGNGQLWIQYAAHNVVTNNIFVAANNGFLVTTTRGDVNNLVDYNVYYSPTGANDVEIHWRDVSFTTFNSYRNASGDDAHSKFALPRLIAGYRLAADSPAIDFGTAHVDWFAPFDRAGVKRPAGSRPDAGAFEFVAAASEMGVTRRRKR